jgi:Collagen triple helix repeat (20 copies)
MPAVTFTITGTLLDFGGQPRIGVKVTAAPTPLGKVDTEAVYGTDPESMVTDVDGQFVLTLVSLPGLWYRISAKGVNSVRLAAYVPDGLDPTTGVPFAPGLNINLQDIVNEDPTPGYEAVVWAGPVGPVGPAGANPEMQVSATHIQWKLVTEGTWNDLVALDTLVGAPGPQGEQGAPGAPGDPGDPGPQGLQGDPGPAGPAGAAGPAGPAGADGVDGADGADGPMGATGPAGVQGPEGAAGDTGLEFKLSYNALTAYDAGDVVQYEGSGYVAIAATTGNLPTNTAFWGPLVLQGAPGPEGPTGATGPPGATGAPGPEGPTGATGAEGPTGATGPQGIQGVPGPVGATGATGATGSAGPSGGGALSGRLKAAMTAVATTALVEFNAEWPTGAVSIPVLIDSELMLVTNIAPATAPNSTVTVVRAQYATAAATHNTNRVVYARHPLQGGGGGGGATSINDLTDVTITSPTAGQTLVYDALGQLVNAAPVPGPAGPQGEPGDPGPAGATGATGPAGDPGDPGPVGATGATGPPGATGAPGADGSAGPAGPAGPTGAPGADGIGVPDPSAQPDGKMLETLSGALVYVDAPNGGSGLYRGIWSGVDDIIASATLTDAGALSAFSSPVLGDVYAFVSTPGGVNPPSQATVLRLGVTGHGYVQFVIPAGVTTMRWYAAVGGGTLGVSQELRINGVVAASYPAADWASYSYAVTPGQTVRLNSQASFGNWGSWTVATIELIDAGTPAPDPYMEDHTVVHADRLWRSTIDNNSATPGVGGSWAEVELTVDIADVTGLQDALDERISGTGITEILPIGQGAYDALSPPDATTLYLITGA